MSTAFLEVEDLETHFPVEAGLIFKRPLGTVRAIDGDRLSIAGIRVPEINQL